MTHPFLALAWESFPTSRPVDWQVREAATMFLRAAESREQSTVVETRAASALHSAIRSRDVARLTVGCELIEQLAGRIQHELTLLRRSCELLRETETERDIAELESRRVRREAGA